jgi:hypothetical protein
MSEFWYYTKDNETRGPIALDQLIKLLSQLPTPARFIPNDGGLRHGQDC